MISLQFNWFICEMLNLTKMCQPNWEYANVIVLIQVNKYECFIIEHGWFKRSMQDNIKINPINALKHSPFPCNGVVCKHTWGVIHGNLKGFFDCMMDDNNLYYNFTPWEKTIFNFSSHYNRNMYDTSIDRFLGNQPTLVRAHVSDTMVTNDFVYTSQEFKRID